MSNQIAVTASYIKNLHPTSIASDKAIGEHFVAKFMAMFQVPKEKALQFFEREKDNFFRRVSESEDLKSCTPMSLFVALMQVGGWKLSLETGSQSDVYLIPGNRNIGTKENPQWIKEVVAQPTPYGEKKIRIENGQIKDASKPVIVYKGDTYEEFLDESGNLRVKWSKGDRGETPEIIGSFIRIEKRDGTHEFKTFDTGDIGRWKAASEKKNRGKGANPLYSSNNGQIDVGFLEGKTLKHAFKLYPRVVQAISIPETFVPSQEAAIRQGLDVSEFTEDIPHQELSPNELDDFDSALNQAKAESKPVTVQVEPTGDFDEPEF